MRTLWSFIAGLAGAILFIALYNAFYHQSIGVVRMDALIGAHIAKKGMQTMSEAEIAKQAELYGDALEASIKDVSIEYRVLLLVNPAVVAGAPDYTELVKQRIAWRLATDG